MYSALFLFQAALQMALFFWLWRLWRERGAVGLVVNVETAQGLARLRALAPGVPLAPAAADDLAERLGLRHYPALVSATGVEQ